MWAKSKLNSIEKLVPQVLKDSVISHEKFKTIINEEENYGRLKEDIRMMKSDDELSENNKYITENSGNAKILKNAFLTCINDWNQCRYRC